MRHWMTILVAPAVLVAVPALVTLAGCQGQQASRAESATESTPAALPVSVVKTTQEDVPRRVSVTGTLAAWEEATVSLEADGRLIEVRVDLGDVVQKGGVLARVSPEAYEYRKAQADAELEAAEADFKRLETLVGKDMATRQQLDESRRRQGIARANAELTAKQLRDTTLRAPIDGLVSRRMVNLGEYVRVGTPAFALVGTSQLKLRADVPERYASDVKAGDPVEAVFEAFSGQVLQGEVVRIGPAVATDTRSFPIEARFENSDRRVKPGTFAKATIRTGTEEQSVTVPEAAVATFAGNPRVFVVEEEKALERPIEIAGRYQDRIMVAKGLAAGETVVSSGVDMLSNGVKVTSRPAETNP